MEGYLICFLLGIITGIVMTLSITHSPRQAEPVVVYESARREESPWLQRIHHHWTTHLRCSAGPVATGLTS